MTPHSPGASGCQDDREKEKWPHHDLQKQATKKDFKPPEHCSADVTTADSGGLPVRRSARRHPTEDSV